MTCHITYTEIRRLIITEQTVLQRIYPRRQRELNLEITGQSISVQALLQGRGR